MQNMQTATEICHYPGCKRFSSVTCRKCHQEFCPQHTHRQWKKSICEFCYLIEQAQGVPQRSSRKIAYIVCALISVSGICILVLGLSGILGVALLSGGIYGVAGVANASRNMVMRPTRASDIDADKNAKRVFGYRDNL
jgi:hypothetical protein